MKTTLKENTIETLQKQTGWKEYIDAIVDSCKCVFDGLFIGIVGYEDGKPVYGKVENENTDVQYSYPILSYRGTNSRNMNNVMGLNISENISLRALLRVLSLYGCSISGIQQVGSTIPHTYKTGGENKRNSNIGGFNTSDMSDDAEIAASDGSSIVDSAVDLYELDSENTDSEPVVPSTYIKGIYGYNQKSPILSKSPVYEVTEFYEFYSGSSNYKHLYVKKDDFEENNGVRSFKSYKINIYKSLYYNGSSVNNDNGIFICDVNTDSSVSVSLLLEKSGGNYKYDLQGLKFKWVRNSGESSYILNDDEDIIVDGVIKYNTDDATLYENTAFSLSDDTDVNLVSLKRVDALDPEVDDPIPSGEGITDGVLTGRDTIDYSEDIAIQKNYYVYKDSKYKRYWIVLDIADGYYKNNPLYVKTQIFSDECTLKTQPLFLYGENDEKVSLCASNTDAVGGDGRFSFEIEAYDTDKVQSDGVTVIDNLQSAQTAQKAVFGADYYKWDVYEYAYDYKDKDVTLYSNPVYTSVDFKNTSIIPSGLRYFFDGGNKAFSVGEYGDNRERTIYQQITPYSIVNPMFKVAIAKNSTMTMVTNPPSNISPQEKGWWEYIQIDEDIWRYIPTADNYVVSGKSYYKMEVNPSNRHWFELINNVYVLSSDTINDDNKTYYESNDPKTEGWYEQSGTQYILTDDTYVDTSKAYYKEENPKSNGWYERSGSGTVQDPYLYFRTEKESPDGTIFYKMTYMFRNTNTRERFDTMYFNHFIKVYPIDAQEDGQVVKTKKLYCDNLDLVMFKNIIPYVVTYNRKGSTGNDGLDCSIFSKIVSYNKYTHLITVDEFVYFEDTATPEYVVVAYQNASPFNKTSKIRVLTPNDDIKSVVKPMLSSFGNQFCTFEIKSESGTEWEIVM